MEHVEFIEDESLSIETTYNTLFNESIGSIDLLKSNLYKFTYDNDHENNIVDKLLNANNMNNNSPNCIKYFMILSLTSFFTAVIIYTFIYYVYK
jgi:hypothetical protein